MTRIAIVHERFTEYGGSERVVAELAALWPDADVLAPLVDPAALPPGLNPERVHDTWLRRLHQGGQDYARLLPLLPLAVRTLPLDAYDLVVTSHHAFANRVRPRPGAVVVSYTHTPARWMWEPDMLAGESGGALGRLVLSGFAATQRRADRVAAARVHTVIANARVVADRVRRHWGREARVIHPPVDVEYYTPDEQSERDDFFLVAGRLVPYKRPEVAVAAAVAAGCRIVVAGEGRARAAVEQAAAGGEVELLGRVDDAELRRLYRSCRALLMPGVEDFGIVPIEAMACGAPVLGVSAGGLLDTVVPGVTGELVAGPDRATLTAGLADTLRNFDDQRYRESAIREHAERFSADAFRSGMAAAVADALQAARSAE